MALDLALDWSLFIDDQLDSVDYDFHTFDLHEDCVSADNGNEE